MKIVTWNVNSVKSRLHALLPFLRDVSPDVLLLQELKTTTDTFPYMEIEELGYNIAAHGQKTYNGVAILSKHKLEDISTLLPGEETDVEARYIEAVISLPGNALRVASVYVPNGQSPDSDRFAYKLRFFERLYRHTQSLLKLEERFVMGGDYNVAPAPLDVPDPARMDGTICYHPLEREGFRKIIYLGMVDAFRSLHPHTPGYSWWDYRGGLESGKGMRIDHLLLSPQARDRLAACEVFHGMRSQEKPSDHAPVMCTLAA